MKKRLNNRQIRSSRFTINHVLVIVLAILIGTQVWLSNRVANTGYELSQLELRATNLEEENRKLLAHNVDYLSLHKLTLKAEDMGYVEPENIINMNDGTKALALK
jgi:hypothetical protein